MLGSTEEAEDVVQTVFVELVARDRADVTLGYLFRAATSRCLNRIRDGRRRQALLDRHGDAVLGGSVPPIDDQVLTLDLLARLIERLPPDAAEILVYRYLDRMSQDEIADLVGLSRKTVGKRLQEIRDQMTALSAEGGPR
jgi:RNA polymerase sigma-70 factor (ECF subfamily)